MSERTEFTFEAAFRTQEIGPDGSTKVATSTFSHHDEAAEARSSFLQLASDQRELYGWIRANPGMWEITIKPKTQE